MADEILNKLGFDVAQALTALQSLDNALAKNQLAFQNNYSALATWNAQAQITLSLLREMASTAAGVRVPKVSMAAGAGPTQAATGEWPPANMESRIQQAIALTDKYGGSVSATGEKLRISGMKGARAFEDLDKKAKQFTISWQMMSRIVITQAIVRALSAIRNMLRDVVANSIDFQRSIAEIQSITPKLEGTFATLGDEVANLSKRFNIPLPQVSEGLYETISDQFITVADRTRIMEAAAKLARVGQMELADATMLLTGTLNAYSMGAENAEATSAKFFKTIEMGRVRGKELSDTIGMVIPYASQLGVSLDEVLAAYVSMTIGGLDAHKAATGLRQVMVAMLKPSENLKKVVRDIGFGSPEQLVQARGLVGSTQAIAEAAKGMGTEVGKSVQNVRALTAQLSLTRDRGEAVKNALKVLGETGSESMQKLYDEFTKMPAERLTKEINALSTTLTQDFGAALVKVLADLLQFFGGAEKMSAGLQALVVTLGIAGAAVATFAAAWVALHLAMGPIGWAIGAISVGLTALVATSAYQSIRAVQDIKAQAQARQQAAYEEVKQKEDALRKVREAEAQEMRTSLSAWEEKAAGLRKGFFRVMDELRVKNTQLIDSTRETLGALVSSQERVVTAYRSAAKDATEAIQQSRQRQATAEASYSDAVFKYANKNKSAYSQVEAYMSRASMLAKEADSAMRGAKTPEQRESALAIFQRAEAAANEAEQIANGTANTLLQSDAQRQVLFLMRQKVEAEQALQALQAAQAQRLAASAAKEQQRLSGMKTLMKAILADLQAFDAGGAREPQSLADQQRRLQANMSKFKTLALTGQETSIADLLGLDQLQQRVMLAIEGGVSKVQLKKFYGTPEAFGQLRQDIETGVGPIKVLLTAAAQGSPEFAKALKDLTAEQGLLLLSEEMGSSAKSLDEFAALRDKLSIARLEMDKSRQLASTALQQVAQGLGDPSAFTKSFRLARLSGIGDEFKKYFDNAQNTFLEQAQKVTRAGEPVSAKTLLEFNNAYAKYVEALQPSPAIKTRLETFYNSVQAMAERAAAVSAVKEKMPEATTRMQQSQQFIQNARQALEDVIRAASQAQQGAQGAGTAAQGAQSTSAQIANIDMTGYISQVSMAASAMWNLASAAASVQTPMAPEFAALGGRAGRYLAAGGPVGTDVVPAWLTRGEVVMNAGASSKFASQLVAMNAGVQPTFRSEGGSVTNIGDINVSVTGGGTGRQTARNIATELRRELRRGTTTL